MGNQKNLALNGTFDNIIYYSLGGNHYKRSKPEYVRRTNATVKTGHEFGRASRLGKAIRLLVNPINPCRDDKRVMFRLTGKLNLLIHCRSADPGNVKENLSALGYLGHFQFNDQGSYLAMERVGIGSKLTENRTTGFRFSPFIPQRHFNAPAWTTEIHYRILVIATNPDSCTVRLLGQAEWEIPFAEADYEPADLDFKMLAEPGDLMLTVAALEYGVSRNGRNGIDQRLNFRPCGIIRTEPVL